MTYCPYCRRKLPVTAADARVMATEAARALAARRKTFSSGRPKNLAPCQRCGAMLGARERRKHRCTA